MLDDANVNIGMEVYKNKTSMWINSEFYIKLGYDNYTFMGINQKKLVMGVPWYGYDYTCQNLSKVREKWMTCLSTVAFTSHEQ